MADYVIVSVCPMLSLIILTPSDVMLINYHATSDVIRQGAWRGTPVQWACSMIDGVSWIVGTGYVCGCELREVQYVR